jgi:hypothetical protein
MDSGKDPVGTAGLWREMRRRWQRAAAATPEPAPLPQPAWRDADLPSLEELLARLGRRAAPAPPPDCLPCD